MFRIILFSLLLLSTAVTAAQSKPDEASANGRYFEGLRQRGLFDLAEGEAIRRLDETTAPAVRARLVAELSRTFTEHAKYVTGREQSDLWMRAEELIDSFLDEHPGVAGRIRLEVLRGELALSRGTTLRWLAELESGVHAGPAEESLAEAVRRLAAAEQQLNRRLRDRLRGRTTSIEPLPPVELDELLTHARLTLGLAELERGRIADGPARRARHDEVERWLTGVAKGAPAEDSTWQAQVGLAEAARLSNQPDHARRRLAELQPADLSDAAKDAMAAVSTRLLIDEGKPDRAVTFLIDYRRTRGRLTGELRLLQIEGLSAAAALLERAGNATEATALRDEIPTVVSWIAAEHGGFWAYRARLAARIASRDQRYGTEAAALVRAAESRLAAGDVAGAIAEYEAATAQLDDRPEAAAEVASARASLLLKAERFDEAAAALAGIVERDPELPNAGDLHLLSAYALGRLHDVEPSEVRRTAYIDRLEEHRSRFAGRPTAAEATFRLARLHEQRRQYSKAIPLFKEVAVDDSRRDAASAAVARNYQNLLTHLRTARRTAPSPAAAAVRDEQIAEWSAAAVRDVLALSKSLRTKPRPSDTVPAEPMSAAQAELALRAAQLLMSDSRSQPATTELLDRLAVALQLDHRAEEQPFWDAARRAALPLQIVSLATQQRFDDAAGLIDSLEQAPVGDLLAVVRGLSDLTETDPGDVVPPVFGAGDESVGTRLTDLRRTATEILSERRPELSPTEAQQLDVVLARANLSDGRTQVAVERYNAALAARPNDNQLLAQAATALQSSGDPQAIRQAHDYWKRLEALETSGSEAWLVARLHRIETLAALADVDEARKLLTVTKLIHFKLGSPETKAAYETIEQHLDAATAANRDLQTR